MNGFCIGAAFTEKIFGAYISHELIVWLITELNLIQSAYNKSLLVIESLAFLFYLIYDVIVY